MLQRKFGFGLLLVLNAQVQFTSKLGIDWFDFETKTLFGFRWFCVGFE
jgi:hypothetical protein